ncbi:MAG: transposase [Actinobacteria bacterium]|nr:transposase [Actinomycetota bacterium]
MGLLPNTKDFRFITKYDSYTYDNAYDWYRSNHGKNLQKLRKTVIEGIMGQAKEYHGMNKAKFRGINKVQIQFLLTATAINLKKLVKIMDIETIKFNLNKIKDNLIELKSSFLRKIYVRFVIEKA